VAEEKKPQVGFVSLKSVSGAKPDPDTALAEIRAIYFKTSQRTVEHDLAHAIELLKSLPEEMRAKAHVYMEGLAEMMREWNPQQKKKRGKRPPR
jgi:hypothetical protein